MVGKLALHRRSPHTRRRQNDGGYGTKQLPKALPTRAMHRHIKRQLPNSMTKAVKCLRTSKPSSPTSGMVDSKATMKKEPPAAISCRATNAKVLQKLQCSATWRPALPIPASLMLLCLGRGHLQPELSLRAACCTAGDVQPKRPQSVQDELTILRPHRILHYSCPRWIAPTAFVPSGTSSFATSAATGQ